MFVCVIVVLGSFCFHVHARRIWLCVGEGCIELFWFSGNRHGNTNYLCRVAREKHFWIASMCFAFWDSLELSGSLMPNA